MKVAERWARRGQPLGLSPAEFLREFWQRRPLLVRRALPWAGELIDRSTLLATARRSGISARIVRRDRPRGPLRLSHGPFEPGELRAPPHKPWTVLVNDLDKHHPERFARLFEHFRFLPRWRIDDVMASLATRGGSVGAHVDRYDVFLIQAAGRREWRLDLRAQGWRPWGHADLRLVRGFRALWRALLEPGDLLYLPPGIPHHGIAREECITLSLGMRAPALGELFGALADAALAQDPPPLLADPGLSARRMDGELTRQDLDYIAETLREPLAHRAILAEAVGRFLSTWRGQATLDPPRRRSDPLALLARGLRLRRRPWLRAVWWRQGARARLAIAGEVFTTSRRLAQLIASPLAFGRAELPRPDAEEARLLHELAARGALELATPAKPVR